jgi:predicted enzyme related to lactoylglutathione lyase
VLGSRVVSSIPEFGWVEVSTNVGGLTLGLTEVPTQVSNRGAVLDFEVEDVERIRGVLAANGVRVDAPATEIAGVARVLSARDLDGNKLMFFEPHHRRST